jgi:hypothetical protein
VVAKKKSGSHGVKAKHSLSEKKVAGRTHTAGMEDTPAIDRRAVRERRGEPDRRNQSLPVAIERRTLERRVKVNRRRQIDPTTCERDYTSDEIEFMGAIDEYKRSSGRMFPTCSEVLEVIKSLGYEKRLKVEPVAPPTTNVVVVATQNPTVVA